MLLMIAMTVTTPGCHDPRYMFAKTVFVDEAIPVPKSNRVPVIVRPSRTKPSSWWAIMLCGLVAGFCSGAAVFASPIGDGPTLKRVNTMITSFATGR